MLLRPIAQNTLYRKISGLGSRVLGAALSLTHLVAALGKCLPISGFQFSYHKMKESINRVMIE